MLQEVRKRLNAAEVLDSADDESDAAYLLRLISFEILLKLLMELHGINPGRTHLYADLFNRLPKEVQAQLLEMTGERIGASALDREHGKVFEDLGSNFIQLRYPYDQYKDMNEAQWRALGTDWQARGCGLNEAVFRYWPEELFGLIYALQRMVEEPPFCE